MLMEHETSKLKDLDEEYATELREWKAQLKPRKQVTRRSKISWGTVMSKNRVALRYDVCPSLCRLDLYLALFATFLLLRFCFLVFFKFLRLICLVALLILRFVFLNADWLL